MLCNRDGALSDFFARNYAFCYLTALEILRDRMDAEDVAQGVFCKIWAVGMLGRYGQGRGWLRLITRNAAIDVLRRRAIEKRYVALYDDEGPSISAEDEVISAMRRRNVVDAMLNVRSGTRGLLYQSFFELRSHSSIAHRSRLPLGTVKTRIRSGLALLRRRLSEPDVLAGD